MSSMSPQQSSRNTLRYPMQEDVQGLHTTASSFSQDALSFHRMLLPLTGFSLQTFLWERYCRPSQPGEPIFSICHFSPPPHLPTSHPHHPHHPHHSHHPHHLTKSLSRSLLVHHKPTLSAPSSSTQRTLTLCPIDLSTNPQTKSAYTHTKRNSSSTELKDGEGTALVYENRPC